MNPSLKSYKVIIKFLSMPEYRTVVRGVNASNAFAIAKIHHRKKTDSSSRLKYDHDKSSSVFAGKHLYIDNVLYCKADDYDQLRKHCALLVGGGPNEAADLHARLTFDREAYIMRHGEKAHIIYC